VIEATYPAGCAPCLYLVVVSFNAGFGHGSIAQFNEMRESCIFLFSEGYQDAEKGQQSNEQTVPVATGRPRVPSRAQESRWEA
jgi:hypothetical protein